MAAVALRPKPSFVFVVILMARDTGAADGGLSPQRFFVTGITVQGRMGTVQYEAGTRVVIKLPQFPVSGIVAALTFRAQSTLVDVLFLVAGNAGGGRVLKGQRQVAFSAGRDLVRAAQGECGRLMIECVHSPPFFRMAGFAFVALLPFMRVVLLVTGVAVGF